MCTLMVRHWSERSVSFQLHKRISSTSSLLPGHALAQTVFLYRHARQLVAATTLTEAEVFGQCNVFLTHPALQTNGTLRQCNFH